MSPQRGTVAEPASPNGERLSSSPRPSLRVGLAVALRSLLLAAGLALAGPGCASAPKAPLADALARVQATESYSARLRLSLKGPDLRGRTSVLVGFQRPDALRVEVPGPAGARLIAVARNGRLAAVFPRDRAFYEGAATPESLEALLGVGLAPTEVMGLLVGAPSPRLRSYEARWGVTGPRRIEATLPNGALLKVTVEDADFAARLPAAAFDDPPHAGYRTVDDEGARALWSSPRGGESSR